MTFTIEPMLNLGTHEWEMWDDGWTVVTKDRRRSAQFEHTILDHRERQRDPHPALTDDHRRATTEGNGMAKHEYRPGHRRRGQRHQGRARRPRPGRVRSQAEAHRHPAASTPEAVCEVIAEIVDHFDDVRGDAPIGVTIPGVVTHGVVRSAANIDRTWIGFDAERLLHEAARARRRARQRRRRGRDRPSCTTAPRKGQEGLVILTTLGTGIGTALIHDGVLIPNSELGHLEIDGYDAETRASKASRQGARTSHGRSGGPGCSSTTATSRRCCGPTSSSSVAASRRRQTGSCRC